MASALFVFSMPLQSQDTSPPAPPRAESPLADLASAGVQALNNLQYATARSYVTQILSDQRRLRRSVEIRALQLGAAAWYPEEGAAQVRDSALTYLRRLVRLAPDTPLPDELSWPGLDSLAATVRASTWAAAARPAASYVLVGSEVPAMIPVLATRPTRFRLDVYRIDAVRRQPTLVFSDSTNTAVTDGALTLHAHNGMEPILRGGVYDLVVSGIRQDVPDTIVTRYRAEVNGYPPTLMRLPSAPDSGRLLPEVAPPARVTATSTGIMLGVATWALASLARGSGSLRNATSMDGRWLVAGVAMGAGAVVAGYFDKGAPLWANIAENRQVREEYRRNAALALELNRVRVADYRVTLTVDLESR